MSRQTTKSDWLNNLLSKKGALVSGDPSFSSQLGIDSSIPAVIRFIYDYKNESFIYVLTIESTSAKEITSFKKQVKTGGLDDFYQLFGENFIVLFYDNQDNFAICNLQKGSVKEVSSDELANYFKKINRRLTNNAGSSKKINKSVNDSFQKWTRKYLTKECVVNDLDAIYMISEGKSVVLELKRVEESVETWQPYLDDIPNYNALLAIREDLNCKIRTYAYNIDNENQVAFHFGLRINDWDSIGGKYIVAEPDYLTGKYIGRSYLSTNKRVNRY